MPLHEYTVLNRILEVKQAVFANFECHTQFDILNGDESHIS